MKGIRMKPVFSAFYVALIAVISVSAFFAFSEMGSSYAGEPTGKITYSISSGSCKNYCGKRAPSGCYCTPECVKYGDCCSDYRMYCSSYSTTTRTTMTTKTTFVFKTTIKTTTTSKTTIRTTTTRTTLKTTTTSRTTTTWFSDADNDGIMSVIDNCPNVYNPSQRDFDSNGVGDSCEGKNYIKIKAYLHSSVNEQEYRQFISDVGSFLSSRGVDVILKVEGIERYSNDCTNSAGSSGADVAMCVGPGKGGYWGPPYYVLGANTDQGFGFTSNGIGAEAHEIMHFLGVVDTCYYPEAMPKPDWLYNDLMTYPYGPNATLSPTEAGIANFNARQISASGREGIYYPFREAVHPSYVKIRLQQGSVIEIQAPCTEKYCTAYEISNFAPSESQKMVLIKSLFAQSGKFSLQASYLDSYFGIKLSCSGREYWIPSKLFDDCFILNSFMPLSGCRISCQTPGEWCQSVAAW